MRAVPNYNVMGVAKAALEAATRSLTGEVHYVDAGFNIGAGDPGVESAPTGSPSLP